MVYVRGARRSNLIKPLPIEVPSDVPEPVGSRLASIPGPKPVFDPAKCGTVPGYKQHHRHGQDPCDPCKAANAAHSAAYRAGKPRTPRALKPCGTHAAYTRHLKAGEKPCAPCTEAHRIYQAGQRTDSAGRTRLTLAPLNEDACGTYRGYKNHTRRGQKACLPCSEARTEYYRDWKANRQEQRAA